MPFWSSGGSFFPLPALFGRGQKTARLTGLSIGFRKSLISKKKSIGSSSTSMGRQCQPAGPPPEAQPTIKKGPNPARRGSRGRRHQPCARVRARRVLFENPPRDRRAGASAWGCNQRGTTPRIGLFYRRDGRGSGASAYWTASNPP